MKIWIISYKHFVSSINDEISDFVQTRVYACKKETLSVCVSKGLRDNFVVLSVGGKWEIIGFVEFDWWMKWRGRWKLNCEGLGLIILRIHCLSVVCVEIAYGMFIRNIWRFIIWSCSQRYFFIQGFWRIELKELWKQFIAVYIETI